MHIVAHHGEHAHIIFLRLPFVFTLIERCRRPKRHARCSRKLLQSASRSPTTLTVLVKRPEKLRKTSEKPSSCKSHLAVMSSSLNSNIACRFEILLSGPISDQDQAAEWDEKKKYAKLKVRRRRRCCIRTRSPLCISALQSRKLFLKV